MTQNILLLPGDGIGPEIMAQAVRVLERLKADYLDIAWDSALIGGCAVDATGVPFPQDTQDKALAADAVLLAAVGSLNMMYCHVNSVQNVVCWPFAKS